MNFAGQPRRHIYMCSLLYRLASHIVEKRHQYSHSIPLTPTIKQRQPTCKHGSVTTTPTELTQIGSISIVDVEEPRQRTANVLGMEARIEGRLHLLSEQRTSRHRTMADHSTTANFELLNLAAQEAHRCYSTSYCWRVFAESNSASVEAEWPRWSRS